MKVELIIGLERLHVKEEEIKKQIELGQFKLLPATEGILNYVGIYDEMLKEGLRYIAKTEYEINTDDYTISIKDIYSELKNKEYSITEYDDVVQIESEGRKGVIVKELYLGGERFINENKIIEDAIESKIRPFLTAFYLYKSGYVNPYPIVVKITRDDGIEISPAILGTYISNMYGIEFYSLSYKELHEISRIIKNNADILAKAIKEEPAFSYFIRGILEENLLTDIIWSSGVEFSILDFIAGMESLFNTNDELKYRLALYVAHAIGENYEERKKYKDLISYLYEIRSKIAHGSSVKIKEKELEKCANPAEDSYKYFKHVESLEICAKAAEDVLRRLLNIYLSRYLAKGRSKKDFKEDIERKILS
ncbi:MAG: hypothetical protein ACP5GS_06975 [Nitrososphaeria archaeon]